ncbi:MAG: hypothetical protein ACYSUC_05350 [Planctomycetota bacterium]
MTDKTALDGPDAGHYCFSRDISLSPFGLLDTPNSLRTISLE